MGSEVAKNELAMYNFMCSIPEYVSEDSASSSGSKDSTDRSLSATDNEGNASTVSSEVSRSTSVLGWADDGHNILSSDGKQGKKAKKVGLELKLRAKMRLLYWQAALPLASEVDVAEWERINVDAWVATMGYDELDAQVPITSMTVAGITMTYEN